MFIHNIDPTLLKIGIFEIRLYGIVYALGFLLAYWMIYKKRKEIEIKKEQIDNLMLFLLIGLMVGARIFHFVFSDPLTFIRNPLEIFMIWHGGMSFFGALLGMFIANFYYMKKIRIDWKKTADILVIAATVALILGRIANFVNGELIGTPSSLPWCVVFLNIDYICRHPYQVYASFSHVLLLSILLVFYKIKKLKKLKEGLIFIKFLIFYSLFRFATDFVREDPRFLGLTVWQYASVLVFGIGIFMLIKQKAYKPYSRKDIKVNT